MLDLILEGGLVIDGTRASRFRADVGISRDRIETIGMGETNFATPNTSKANKAKNRRVEIIVVKSK